MVVHEKEHIALHGKGYDAGRLKVRRPVTDYGTSMVTFMRGRKRGRDGAEIERPNASYIVDMIPPQGRLRRPVDSIPARHLHQSTNKNRHPINVVRWTPEGRRLLTGSSSGEFTLWNGMSFNFETIMSAHDTAVRAAIWSHSDEWLLSADQDGIVKYWQNNLNNVKIIPAHDAAIRDLSFAPTDVKFVTASDDSSLKVFDFAAGVEDISLAGHGWDVKTVDWHPTKGLLVSGSKDHQIKLWDPRNGRCLTTLHGHKTTISKVSFQPTGTSDLLATCARDTTARIFDIRMMRDVLLLRGHEKDITTLCWHPIHTSLLSTGANDGALYHYLLDEPNNAVDTTSISPYDHADPQNAPAQTILPAHKVPFAHEQAIWSLDWHPLGHILASGSNDRFTRFWTRARPGDSSYLQDPYHLGQEASKAAGYNRKHAGRSGHTADDGGDEQHDEDDYDGLVDQKMPGRQPALPGLPGLPGLQAAAPPLPPAATMSPSNNTNGFPPPPPPQFAGSQPPMPGMGGMIPPQGMPPSIPPPGMDMARFQEMARSGVFPPPPPPPNAGQFPGQYPPPPPNQFGGVPPPGMGGFPPPPPPNGAAPNAMNPGLQSSIPGLANAANGGNVRKRAPLPSQQDSLREEMKRGNYRRVQ